MVGEEDRMTVFKVGKNLSNGNGGMNPTIETVALALKAQGVEVSISKGVYGDGRDLLTFTGPTEVIKGLKVLFKAQTVD
jgi:hypothetical protein